MEDDVYEDDMCMLEIVTLLTVHAMAGRRQGERGLSDLPGAGRAPQLDGAALQRRSGVRHAAGQLGGG